MDSPPIWAVDATSEELIATASVGAIEATPASLPERPEARPRPPRPASFSLKTLPLGTEGAVCAIDDPDCVAPETPIQEEPR